MPALIFLIAAYGAGLLIMRSTIAVNITYFGGIIWLDMLVAMLFATAFFLLILNRPIQSFSLPSKLISIPAALVFAALFGILQLNPARTPTIAAVATTNLIESRLNRAWDGHFRAIAQINDTDVGLLVDTGASLVLLRYDDALRMGIDPDALNFTIPLTTAGGRSHVAPYVFETIQVGNVVVHNIAGAIAPSGTLHSSLLGMTFLEQLTETVIRENAMILRK